MNFAYSHFIYGFNFCGMHDPIHGISRNCRNTHPMKYFAWAASTATNSSSFRSSSAIWESGAASTSMVSASPIRGFLRPDFPIRPLFLLSILVSDTFWMLSVFSTPKLNLTARMCQQEDVAGQLQDSVGCTLTTCCSPLAPVTRKTPRCGTWRTYVETKCFKINFHIFYYTN